MKRLFFGFVLLTGLCFFNPSAVPAAGQTVEIVLPLNLGIENVKYVDYAPDLTKIVFQAPGSGGLDDLWVVDADGSNLQNLTGTDQIGESFPAWSPDGEKIAFCAGSQILLMNKDGSGKSVVVNSYIETPVDWSPDGTQLVYAGKPAGYSYTSEILVVPAKSSVLDSDKVRMTTNDVNDYAPRWSPDGEWILFSSQDGVRKVSKNRYPTITLTSAGISPDWSPDGTQIVYVKDNNGQQDLWVMNSDGSEPARLTQSGGVKSYPRWIDDDRILFISQPEPGTYQPQLLYFHRDPQLAVTSPPGGFVSDQDSIVVTGQAVDNAGIADITLSSPLLTKTIAPDGDGNFTADFPLAEGENAITITARDLGNNQVSQVIGVVYDAPPHLVLNLPEADFLTKDPETVVQGRAWDVLAPVSVKVNGQAVQIDEGGDFTVPVGLDEGLNLLSVLAVDAGGKETEVIRRVYRDSTPPVLAVTGPQAGSTTESGEITVAGSTEPGADVTVNGTAVAETDGNFSCQVQLFPGANEIRVAVADRAGNETLQVLTVNYRLPQEDGGNPGAPPDDNPGPGEDLPEDAGEPADEVNPGGEDGDPYPDGNGYGSPHSDGGYEDNDDSSSDHDDDSWEDNRTAKDPIPPNLLPVGVKITMEKFLQIRNFFKEYFILLIRLTT